MNCPVCGQAAFVPLPVPGRSITRCLGCGCIAFEAPPPPADSTARIGAAAPYPQRYLDILNRRGFRGGPLIDPATGYTDLAPASYDAAILPHRLHTEAAPGQLLQNVHAALKSGAPLLLTVPLVDFTRPAPWPSGYRWSFDETTIQLLLLRHGFHQVLACKLSTREMLVTAVRYQPAPRPKCSIIVPVYNESRTFPVLMDALLKKNIPGLDRQIIVIESNSTDGTRELAQQYRRHPAVQVVLQDAPRGKGHAVREGFRHATGDIVLIQDADLEYDLEDYDALLEPILSNRALFVLGTRHAGDWKVRQFASQKILSTSLNLGHAFFTGLINVLFRQHMTDPFTMFKVFRRDCLFGLQFECDRFDFDHELVIKLVRKGYQPLEIPVNYQSRSFHEGKKVRLFRDPFTWLWVDLKLRFSRILPKGLF
jgi:Glycosyl transferase family 2